MTETPTKSGRGCLFYGSIAATVLILLVIAGGIVGFRLAKKMVTDFTDPAAQPAPVANAALSDTADLRKRVDDFRNDVRAARSPAPLSLSPDEINQLIATDPDLQSLKG